MTLECGLYYDRLMVDPLYQKALLKEYKLVKNTTFSESIEHFNRTISVFISVLFTVNVSSFISNSCNVEYNNVWDDEYFISIEILYLINLIVPYKLNARLSIDGWWLKTLKHGIKHFNIKMLIQKQKRANTRSPMPMSKYLCCFLNIKLHDMVFKNCNADLFVLLFFDALGFLV